MCRPGIIWKRKTFKLRYAVTLKIDHSTLQIKIHRSVLQLNALITRVCVPENSMSEQGRVTVMQKLRETSTAKASQELERQFSREDRFEDSENKRMQIRYLYIGATLRARNACLNRWLHTYTRTHTRMYVRTHKCVPHANLLPDTSVYKFSSVDTGKCQTYRVRVWYLRETWKSNAVLDNVTRDTNWRSFIKL